ncbi:hypothetical protein ANO14919_087410 [Xylariales sp. No.14919]|nr:hypothetical protein ANO14919_087410 [Xylariales sp. No.14919]
MRCNRNDILCEFPQPKTERRKRRKPPAVSSTSTSSAATDVSMAARLDRYESILKALGINIEPTETLGLLQARAVTSSPIRHVGAYDDYVSSTDMTYMAMNGRLVGNGNQSCFVDNNVNTSILPSGPIDYKVGDARSGTGRTGTGADGLALYLSPGTGRIRDLYPSQHQFSLLWQTYLDNIQPITMILHVPSASIQLAEATKSPDCTSRDSEVLLFAVMASALVSITDDECQRKLCEERSTLLSRYRLGCEMALVNAKFLTSPNFAVLQAYTVYLSVVSVGGEPFEIWNLAGIAKRNALRLGLHQEIPGLTPFEVEMRRRLWLQINTYDVISAELEGLHWPEFNYEIIAPSAVNDSDLCHTTKTPPTERTGATDMIYCNLRCKILNFMVGSNSKINLCDSPGQPWTSAVKKCSRVERENAILELEKEMELGFLRYCDILNPVHVLTTTMARLTVSKLRFMMLDSGHMNQLAVEDKELMLSAALRVLEYENITYSQPSMRGFLWHTGQGFHWPCLIRILEHLPQGIPYGEQAEKSWEQIRMSYELRPGLLQIQKHNFPLLTRINQLTLEAWRVREARAFQDSRTIAVPAYITALREQEHRVASEQQELSSEPSSVVDSPRTPEDGSEGALLALENFEQGIVSWAEWNSWDITSPNPGDIDTRFFDPMPSLNHRYNDTQSRVLPITRRNQGADDGKQTLKIQFPSLS